MIIGLLLASATYLDIPDITIVDSKASNKISYIIVGECVVPVEKKKLKDLDYILSMVDLECGLGLEK